MNKDNTNELENRRKERRRRTAAKLAVADYAELETFHDEFVALWDAERFKEAEDLLTAYYEKHSQPPDYRSNSQCAYMLGRGFLPR